jgi:hypothetical protein
MSYVIHSRNTEIIFNFPDISGRGGAATYAVCLPYCLARVNIIIINYNNMFVVLLVNADVILQYYIHLLITVLSV